MLRHNRGVTTTIAIAALALAGFDGSMDAHSLTKTLFAPTDESVLFARDYDGMGSILVIYDRSLSTNHSQYHCAIHQPDPTIARPLMSADGWCADTLTDAAMTRIPPGSYSFLQPRTVDCRQVSYVDCQAAEPAVDEIEFTVTEASLYSCAFDPPLNDPTVRAWPLQALLPISMYIHDADAMLVTGADILPPVVNLAFADEAGERSDATHLISAAGQATTGTHFHFDAVTSRWVLTLDTTALTRPGRYTVSVTAGGTNYLLEPGCSVQLTRK